MRHVRYFLVGLLTIVAFPIALPFYAVYELGKWVVTGEDG